MSGMTIANALHVLGIGADASAHDVKSAYVKLAKQFHPDFNPNNQQAEDSFKRVQEAYQLLAATERKNGTFKISSPTDHAHVLDHLAEYYVLLGVPIGAGQDAVKTAYFARVKFLNDSKLPHEDYKKQLGAVEYAYNMLTGRAQQHPDDW
jgi:DnaJ-class molecular chaperone